MGTSTRMSWPSTVLYMQSAYWQTANNNPYRTCKPGASLFWGLPTAPFPLIYSIRMLHAGPARPA
ncbi:hypothetical protein I7I53_11146 [Histoplasma capsulatum var. duboisii H88]|uniref:Uncharacterized protein n=1 Tax=Ajellomyces capsulatus (strain H88) TaxID=544711 RepID=A0A8A1LCR1_AJEC8|nr:hypothetical protein I7I53_11146 [Histoplasma capsulatum var. duboisii H88]